MTTTSGEIEQMDLGREVGLISCLSFEERALHGPAKISKLGLRRWISIANRDIESNIDSIKARASALATEAGARFSIHECSKRYPLLLADTLVSILNSIRKEKNLSWVVDISTMTHEMVLVLVAALDEIHDRWPNLTIIYNVAGQYSENERDLKRKWVSRGIHGIRSVVGFSGLPSPGEITTLVALPGFDLERVSRIVDELEPDNLLVGIGTPLFSEHAWLYQRNVEVARHLTAVRRGEVFDYSSLDAEEAVRAVIDRVGDIDGNVVLAPLNSKVSTFATGLVGRKIPEWQICYAPALIYNTNYATASERFISFKYDNLRKTVDRLVVDALKKKRIKYREYA